MRSLSRSALVSLACLLAAGFIYLLGRMEGNRMVSTGQGWEMAFYWSPLVFYAIDTVLIVGIIAGLVGLAIESGMHRRLQAVVAGLVCVGSFLALPWR
jgi:hypothetical protein